mgnify:CR=1 FL=1
MVIRNIKGDLVIWIVVVLLSLYSILAVYSSIVTLAYKYKAGDTESYLIKHVVLVGFGLLLMYLTHKIKYTYYSRLSQIALWLAAPLLLFTLFKGTNINDASRWIEVPVLGVTFQTSDFAKLALIAYVARMLALRQNEIKDFKRGFLPIVIPVIAICGLIFPANFSTAATLFGTCFVLLFIGRVHWKHLLLLIGSGAVFLLLIVFFIFKFPDVIPRGETWKARVESFINNEQDAEGNFQVEQAQIAVSTGGLTGKGPGKSTQRNFLPHPYSDFIFAIITEEYGLIFGALPIILLYLILLFRGVRIASRAEKPFGSFLVIGISMSLVFQAMIHMAVAVHLFPVTGQPLPLVSMGGTSIWFTCIAIGIILSVSRETEKENLHEGGEVEPA